jgi:hypothetical protein
LILAGVNSTGISAEALLRLASPVFLFLASLALFIFLGRTPAAALGAILFATFPEVLLFSSSSGLPSVASLFPLAILLAILFMRKTFPLLPAILLAISVGALHPLSAQVLFGFTVLFFIFTRNPKTILLGVAGLAVPLIWVSIFPFTTPLWGANANFLSTLLTSFSPLHIAGVTLLAFSLPALLAFGGLALATVWFPLLPLRFALYLAFPLALAAAKTKSRLFAAAFAITLLAFAPLTLSSVSPIIQPADRAALVWIDENLSKPVVAGHTDFSSIFLLGHARTIIDGFSEGVPDALERQAAIKASYDSLNFSGLCTKYGAKYVFTDKAEERLGHFATGKPLFDNSYSKVLKLACQGAS